MKPRTPASTTGVGQTIQGETRERARVELVVGRRAVDEERGPEHDAERAPRPGDPVRRHVPLRDEEPDAGEDEQHRADVHRDDAHREEREEQAERAHRAREDHARVVELDPDPERPEEHEERDDVRVGEERQEPLPDRRLVRHERGVPRPDGLPGARPPSPGGRPPARARRAGRARPSPRPGASPPPRRWRRRSRAPPSRPSRRCAPRSFAIERTSAAVSFSTFFAMSFPASSATSLPPRVTGCAAPMFEAGCMTATFAAMVRKTPAEAACAPAGPDPDDDRHLAREHRLDDLARGVEGAARACRARSRWRRSARRAPCASAARGTPRCRR